MFNRFWTATLKQRSQVKEIVYAFNKNWCNSRDRASFTSKTNNSDVMTLKDEILFAWMSQKVLRKLLAAGAHATIATA